MSGGLAAALGGIEGRDGLERIWAALPEARLVGGVVRDLLARRPLADLDLATPEPPGAVMERLRGLGIKVVPTGLAHGTVTAVLEGQPFEITTLRRDVETDGRHAVVAWTDDWGADAARRDFTINAMSLGRDGTLHDYFDGAADLAAGRVRFVGEAPARIAEDALRILRYFRFQARYGTGDPDAGAVAAIADGVALLRPLSAERVWSELRRLLAAEAPAAAARLMERLGVLAMVLPQGGDPERLARLLALDAPADALLRLAALAAGEPGAVAARLRLANAEAVRLAALRAGPRAEPALDDDALRRLLADVPAALLLDRAWLDQPGSPLPPDAWQGLRDRIAAMPGPVFPLSGRDAVTAGLPAGPAVGAALRAVGEWWRQGGCVADRAACLARLAGLAAPG